MATLSYYIKPRHNKKQKKFDKTKWRRMDDTKTDKPKKRRNWDAIRPTAIQFMALCRARNILSENQHKNRNKVIELLRQSLPVAVNVEVKRFTMSGGVGSFRWMPKLRKYRIQVAASRITTKKHSYRYAPCIEI